MSYYTSYSVAPFSKKQIVDLLIIQNILPVIIHKRQISTNNFVSLRAPFHYKLVKNSLHMQSIQVIGSYSSNLYPLVAQSKLLGFHYKWVQNSKIRFKL